MSDPWAFGWTQLLAIAGLAVTVGIAIAGFRTFGRFKKEKLEEKRIEAAIDALAMVYESNFVFSSIRSPMIYSGEWDDLDAQGNEELKRERGPHYAKLKRVRFHKEFFERAWKAQARCAAIFGPEMETIFTEVQKARREIEVAADMLMTTPPSQRTDKPFWLSLDVSLNGKHGRDAPDQVADHLAAFRTGIERICRPVVDHEFRQS